MDEGGARVVSNHRGVLTQTLAPGKALVLVPLASTKMATHKPIKAKEHILYIIIGGLWFGTVIS